MEDHVFPYIQASMTICESLMAISQPYASMDDSQLIQSLEDAQSKGSPSVTPIVTCTYSYSMSIIVLFYFIFNNCA